MAHRLLTPMAAPKGYRLSELDGVQQMRIDRADEAEHIELAGRWLRQLTFCKSAIRNGRHPTPMHSCTADVDVLSRAVMRAAAGRSQDVSIKPGCAAKKQISACSLRTYLSASGEFFSALTAFALRGGSRSRFAKADPRQTGTIDEQAVRALIQQLLTVPDEGDLSSEEDEEETIAREMSTASGRMGKLLDQRRQTREKVHQQWKEQDRIVSANIQVTERRRQQQQQQQQRRIEEIEDIKREGRALADLELEIKQTECEQRHYCNKVKQERAQDQAQENAQRSIRTRELAETAIKRKFLVGREKDRRRAAKEVAAYVSGHSMPAMDAKVAKENHRQLVLLEQKLEDLNRTKLEAKAAERAQEAKTQEILLGAMYASSKEAARQQLSKVASLNFDNEQSDSHSSDWPLESPSSSEEPAGNFLKQGLDDRQIIYPPDHQYCNAGPEDQIYQQLRRSNSKTILQPVDELVEEDFDTRHQAASPSTMSPSTMDGTSTMSTYGTSTMDSTSAQDNSVPSEDQPRDPYANLVNLPSWYTKASKANPELLLQASIHKALEHSARLGAKRPKSKTSTRPRTSGAQGNRRAQNCRRPKTALGYQNTSPEPQSWKRGAISHNDAVSDKMEQILHNNHWSSRVQGENTKQWSAARKRWAWVPVKPDYCKRDHRAQGRHALQHGFVLDSVATNKRWEPIALRENSLLRVG